MGIYRAQQREVGELKKRVIWLPEQGKAGMHHTPRTCGARKGNFLAKIWRVMPLKPLPHIA